MSDSRAIADFWRSFQGNAGALSKLNSADDPLYDELLEKLQKVDAGLYFEFSVQPGQCELIITAEGNRELFACVEDVVAAAPAVDGWKLFALKPKIGFPETVSWEGFKTTIADVVFDPLDNDAGELGLRLLVKGLKEEDYENAHNGLLRAIDHGLGERQFADAIQHTEVATLEGAASDYIPLAGLEDYIVWRKQRRDR